MTDDERKDLRKLLAAPAGTMEDHFQRLADYDRRFPSEYTKEYEAVLGHPRWR